MHSAKAIVLHKNQRLRRRAVFVCLPLKKPFDESIARPRLAAQRCVGQILNQDSAKRVKQDDAPARLP